METKICKYCKKEKELNDFDKKGEYYLNFCKECRREKRKRYYQENREEEIKRTKKYQLENKKHVKEVSKKYRDKNKNKIYEYNKQWQIKNKDRRRQYDNELKMNKKQKDRVYHLKCNIRSMLNTSFKRKKYLKNSKNQKIIGCDYDMFINHLLKTYHNNYGYEWDGKEPVHIDHIKPLKECNTEKEVIRYCHYTNLQLLKAKDNLQKSAKLNWELH